jgi:hypothetical protein
MIPRPDDLSIGHRIVVTFLLVLAILLFLALLGFLTGGWDEQPRAEELSKWDSRMLELDKQALDLAYTEQLKVLFSVWLRDGAGTDALRISNGLRIARRAYVQAATRIEERERK